jgi:tetratricopeptide (TPR) repeat protein
VLRDQGRLEEAMAYFQRALAIDEGAFGSDHPTVANRLNNLGSVLRDQGRLEEAMAYFRRALVIDERALGPDHPSSAITLNNLAAVYSQAGTGDHDANLREAIRLFDRARAIFERLGSLFETGQALGNLAAAYSQLRSGDRHENTQRALSHCDDALRVFRRLGVGPDQSKIVKEVERTRTELASDLTRSN